ncbi:MAG: polysaccharide biosynthesis protein [Deltaproteobacteria bacterium HGW-Deltaproteobacteria-15]|nr:MAG: polysaccharide biosynthesis protein [Deltaproteobacteria bacterium HGW-Deltaproteobacteria-15]
MLSQLRNRNFWLMLWVDAFLIALAYHFSYLLRFDGNVPQREMHNFLMTLPWIVPLKAVIFFFFGLYRGMWRYTSIHDLLNLVKAAVVGSAVIALILVIGTRFEGFARSVFLIDLFLTFLFVGGYRIGIRLLFDYREGRSRHKEILSGNGDFKRVLVIGAGDAGELLIREVRENKHISYHVVGLIDDNESKVQKTIHGVPVLGTLNDLVALVKNLEIDELIIAIPSASAVQMRRIVNFCETSGVPYKTIPGIGELIEGRVSVNFIREVRYEDLLGREPVELNMEQIGGYITDKRVLVTGGAGSIGSELLRQIGSFKPKTLVILDRNESGLYEIELEIRARFPEVEVAFVLGAIQNRELMEDLFDAHRPQVVFHAAAYKHVPMMEIHPWEAVFNNIVGSMVLLELCNRKKVERTVVVSTDKAVRPTNVMGASKRVVELLAQAYAHMDSGRFMAVRFGNVVGSAGSVIPLFKNQIKRGGPVTVTDPDVTRYFMTIPEASRLILQAGALGNGGEIFILKMGTPIRIMDMAKDIIQLSGFTPGKDIEIKVTGLRPGEKLHEELITEGEGIVPSEHQDIMVLNTYNLASLKKLQRQIQALVDLAIKGDGEGIKMGLHGIVPEYVPQVARVRKAQRA